MSKIKKTKKTNTQRNFKAKLSVSLLGLDLNYHDFLVDQVRKLWLTQVILPKNKKKTQKRFRESGYITEMFPLSAVFWVNDWFLFICEDMFTHLCLALSKSLLDWTHKTYIWLGADWSFLKINCLKRAELAAVMWGTRIGQLRVYLRSSPTTRFSDKPLCSSFQEFDCGEMWNTFFNPRGIGEICV